MMNDILNKDYNFHKVHNYYVGDKIDFGSFSSIYSAINKDDFSNVVMKLISKKKISKTNNCNLMLFNESVLAQLLNHQHIAKIKETINTKYQIFQVMDYYVNGNLTTYLDNFKPRKEQILILIDQICSSIEYLHSLHICHRDIKPDNVLISNSFDAKLIDFGFADFTYDKKNRLICGSPGFVAPEILSGDEYDGKKADIWSLGILIYSMFVKDQIINQTLDISRLPKKIRFLVRMMTQKNPNLRPDIKQVRDHPAFAKIQKVPSINVRDFNEPIGNINNKILYRLCEFLQLDLESVIDRLNSNKIYKEKIMYFLVEKFIEKEENNETNNEKSLEKKIRSCKSCPEKYGNSIFDERLLRKEVYNASWLEVERKLFIFLLVKNYCISANPEGMITFVLNLPGKDIVFNAEIKKSKNFNKCKIIYETFENKELVNEIDQYLRKSLMH